MSIELQNNKYYITEEGEPLLIIGRPPIKDERDYYREHPFIGFSLWDGDDMDYKIDGKSSMTDDEGLQYLNIVREISEQEVHEILNRPVFHFATVGKDGIRVYRREIHAIERIRENEGEILRKLRIGENGRIEDITDENGNCDFFLGEKK